jgi:rhamnose transport system permease protein
VSDINGNISRWLKFKEIGITLIIILIVVIAAVNEPRFLSPANLRNILLYIPLITVVAMGQMMVVVSRNVDLSVGSILGFTGIIVGMIFVNNIDFPIWLAILLSIIIGALLGAVNGLLVTWFRLPAIIATLATLNIYRGLLFIYSGGKQVDPNYIPEGLIRLSQSQNAPFGIPWLVFIAAFVAIMAFLFLKYTHTGRQIYAIGSNPEAAKLRGINVNRIIFMVFTLTGAGAGLAGIMYASRFGYVNPGITGLGFEFVVITAVIVGGTSIFGGSGSISGTVLGCILLGVINVALAVLGISTFWQQATYGFFIIISLITDRAIQLKVSSALKRGVV